MKPEAMLRDDEGWLYVMHNPAFPGVVKVGRTQLLPKVRAAQLSTTGVIGKFDVAYEALTFDHTRFETTVHRRLSWCQVEREFFRCDVGEAVAAIQHVAGPKISFERGASAAATACDTEHTVVASIDYFCNWARSLEESNVRFTTSSRLHQYWLLCRPQDIPEPASMKAMVQSLKALGYRHVKQGGSGLRGFSGLAVPDT
ncbi:GIY-YIG nuclease family protein [Paraburkholderia sp. RL18-101-BIB-B]|uniref:GIY-YIG nuclease family protein n=1 Tax=Paraburkholderia sp. RL18-101-BIB-B TaxID=3031634 RepID=UPI0038BC1E4F